MAKGNMLQGQASGKVGDLVFMVRNGQQISRVYTASGGRSGDQASIAVRRQRVRFGAASNQYLLYRNIVRGMYRTGKQTRQSDYNYFVRENVDLLPYLTKEENAAGVKCAMPGTFSRGTLGSLTYDLKYTVNGDNSESYEVQSAGSFLATNIGWDATVATFKAALKVALPNARKVAYAIIRLIRQEVETPSGVSYTHSFIRHDVVFDLYEEDAEIQDSATVAAYFRNYVKDAEIEDAIAGQVDDIADDSTIFKMQSPDSGDSGVYQSLYVLVFATNDQVGDSYTSTLAAINTPDVDGFLSLYASLRTDNHRQVAEDSYGYATGVMRTNIQQS